MKLFIVKNFIVLYVNLASIFWLLLDQRLTIFYQLLSWISFGPSKYPIYKMIGSQGHQRVLGVFRVPYVLDKISFTEFLFEVNKFWN